MIDNIPQLARSKPYNQLTAFLHAVRDTAAKAEAADASGTGVYIQFPRHLI